MKKKPKWGRPRLTVLKKSTNSEERVLYICKANGTGGGYNVEFERCLEDCSATCDTVSDS